MNDDYGLVDGEEEQQIIAGIKKLLKDVVLDEEFYSGMEKPGHFAVYALLELAAEVAISSDGSITSFFIDAAHEVDDVFTRDPDRFINNYDN